MSSGVPKPGMAPPNPLKLVRDGQGFVAINKTGEGNIQIQSRSVSSYLETRFENDIKTLINRTDRLESLMERLLEANLANNELVGEMFKDLKMFMITKRVQSSNQSYERSRPISETERQSVWQNTNDDHELSGQQQEQEQPVANHPLLDVDVMEEIVEGPTNLMKVESNRRTSQQTMEPKRERITETEYVPVEIVEDPSDVIENYMDEKSLEADYTSDDQQIPGKAFHLPLKTIHELLIFDQELKSSEEFQKNAKDIIRGNKDEIFDLNVLIFSVIDKRILKTNRHRYTKAHFLIRTSYLCDTYLYENFVSPYMSKKDYLNELQKILNIIPMKVDPNGMNFPIETESDLIDLETRLKNPEDYTKFMQKLTNFTAIAGNLQGKPLLVNLLSKIINVDLIMAHNWEGKHGKKKLAEYCMIFSECLRTAVGMPYEDFDVNMKKAMRTLQNREHIHISRAKKRLSTVVVE